MRIHVVRSGENIYSIAKQYKVSWLKIISDNALKNPDRLVIGQTLVILFPKQVHIVKPGETLESIAQQYGITVINLLQNNPSISNSNAIHPGQELVISYTQPKLGTFAINGYTYPNIDKEVLKKTLPYLTYITLFTYGITPAGELIDIKDEEIITIARDYGVAPLMLISTLGPDGKFSNELASIVLNNSEVQNKLIDYILKTLKEKNYYGLDIDFEYVFPEDREAYIAFIQNTTTKLNAEGYPVIVALAPKVSSDQKGLLYESHDYRGIGEAANYVLLMTYEWGYTYGPPMAVAPINKVREVLDYAVTVITPEIIFMGVPNYGYNWSLPYIKGVTKAKSIGNVEAVDLAAQVGAIIQYDEIAQSPYFEYYGQDAVQHIVWFEDARSIDAKARLPQEYGFNGLSYWNIMKFFPQNWLVVNALYNIQKVI